MNQKRTWARNVMFYFIDAAISIWKGCLKDALC